MDQELGKLEKMLEIDDVKELIIKLTQKPATIRLLMNCIIFFYNSLDLSFRLCRIVDANGEPVLSVIPELTFETWNRVGKVLVHIITNFNDYNALILTQKQQLLPAELLPYKVEINKLANIHLDLRGSLAEFSSDMSEVIGLLMKVVAVHLTTGR